jgi:hypothetical protein
VVTVAVVLSEERGRASSEELRSCCTQGCQCCHTLQSFLGRSIPGVSICHRPMCSGVPSVGAPGPQQKVGGASRLALLQHLLSLRGGPGDPAHVLCDAGGCGEVLCLSSAEPVGPVPLLEACQFGT